MWEKLNLTGNGAQRTTPLSRFVHEPIPAISTLAKKHFFGVEFFPISGTMVDSPRRTNSGGRAIFALPRELLSPFSEHPRDRH